MTKSFQRTLQENRALAAYVKLLRASETVHARVTRHLDEAGLTPSQFAVLEALYHVGPLCLSELARKILKTGGNLTMVVNNLERRHLVNRIQNAQDRRFFQVVITPSGRKLIGEVFPRHLGEILRAMNVLTAAEQESLAKLCRRLGLGQR